MTFPGLEGEVAYDPRPISKAGSERLIRMGFEVAETRNGAPLTGSPGFLHRQVQRHTGLPIIPQNLRRIASHHPEQKPITDTLTHSCSG